MEDKFNQNKLGGKEDCLRTVYKELFKTNEELWNENKNNRGNRFFGAEGLRQAIEDNEINEIVALLLKGL